MSLTQEKDPAELTDDELLERVAAMDADNIPIAETAGAALEQRQEDDG